MISSIKSWLPLVVLCSLLPAVIAGAGEPATYTVRRGDNLTVIGRRLGVPIDELLRTNALTSDRIYVGQQLRVLHPLAGLSGREPHWVSPLTGPGEILRGFGPYREQGVLMPSTGVDIACPRGTEVRAPETGIVRHVGYVEGFGLLVIIEHAGSLATVLSPLRPSSLNLTVNQAVLRGDRLGLSGPPIVGHEPYLHIELRRDNKAIDPAPLLP